MEGDFVPTSPHLWANPCISIKYDAFIGFKSSSLYTTPSPLCCYLAMNPAAEKNILETVTFQAWTHFFLTMLQFYFQMIYLFIYFLFFAKALVWVVEVKPIIRCVGRENELEGERVALWCSMSGLSCILLALFTKRRQLIRVCIHQVYLRGKCFIICCLWNRWLIVLRSLFSHLSHVHSSPSAVVSPSLLLPSPVSHHRLFSTSIWG